MMKLVTALALLSASHIAVAQTEDKSSAGTAAPQVVAPSNPDAIWRPTDSQIARVQSETTAYFAARDGGRIDSAYDKFAPTQKATVPLAPWRSAIESFNAKSGGVTSRTLRKVTWYKDPQGRPGTYAAVDFSSTAPNLALHCGYVVWQEQSDGSFLMLREEDNVIDRTMETKLKPGDLDRIRAEFRC
jgi:hypothetical protein